MKLCLLSDLHYGNRAPNEGSGSFTVLDHRALAKAVHAEKPDVLAITGDVGETCIDPLYLGDCLDAYKNPHGESLCLPGNHCMWLSREEQAFERGWESKYEGFFRTAVRHGWIGLRDEPFEREGVWIVGNMGWYDFSTADPMFGLSPEVWDKNGDWSDYGRMKMKSSLEMWGLRKAELAVGLGKVPKDRVALVMLTHIVGFGELLSNEFRRPDHGRAFMGNTSIGEMAIEAGADLVYCGHSHRRMIQHGVLANGKPQLRMNNGSGYGKGSKKCDVFEIGDGIKLIKTLEF